MLYSLKGRRVLVTGGSRGLGALICDKFAAEGADVMVNYVSNVEKAEVVVKNAQAHGVRAYAIQGVPQNRHCISIRQLLTRTGRWCAR